jgi:hypothetical protein
LKGWLRAGRRGRAAAEHQRRGRGLERSAKPIDLPCAVARIPGALELAASVSTNRDVV